MATRLISAGYDSRFGFMREHWQAILAYARDEEVVVLFRAGKEACIRWIREKYPAKPLTIKAKIDPRLGLLIARTESERQEVGRAGHLILRQSPKFPSQYDLYNPARPTEGTFVFTPPWPRDAIVEGVVADAGSKLPITSDYDLAAIVPQSGEYRFLPAVLTAAEAAPGQSLTRPARPGRAALDEEPLKAKLKEVADPGRGFTNPWASTAADDLNARFRDDRIMHGPQALYVAPQMVPGSTVALPDAQLANGPSETILAFCPDQAVHLWQCGAPADSRGILPRYYAGEGLLAQAT